MSIATASNSVPKKIGLGVWVLGFLGLLVPFAVIGESWGTLWMYVAAPSSFVAEDMIGIGRDSYFLTAFVSACAAAIWALVVYAAARLFVFAKKRSNQSATDQRP